MLRVEGILPGLYGTTANSKKACLEAKIAFETIGQKMTDAEMASGIPKRLERNLQ